LIIAGGCLTIVLGWVLRKWTPKWGFVLICMGPFLLIIVAPAMYSDYVLIDDEHFETSYGFWFSPTVQNLRFKELREIRFVEVPRRRGGTEIELQCITHAGEIHVVHGGSLVTNTVPEMLARAKAKGVLVPNQIP
jgi:hypothetical protein